MKIDCRIYKGIEYVQLQELPPAQQEKLLQSPVQDLFIKIMIDRKIVGPCIQYKDYNLWYDKVYTAHKVAQQKESHAVSEVVNIKASLALNKF
jgi:hypothetical protein